MATTEEIARDLLASMNTDAGFLNAVKWLDARYRELCSRFRPRHLRQIGEVQLPSRVSTGTVATTRDTLGVAGSSTSWLTAPLPTTASDDLGGNWYFRAESAWYKISLITASGTIALATAYSEDGGSSKAYNIVKRHHSLSSGARWLGDAVLTRLRIPIRVISHDALNRESPGRTIVGHYPDTMVQVGTDSSNHLSVEFYPYNDESEIVHYVYWDMPTTLATTTTIPPQVDAHILKEGALIDLYRYMKANALDKGNVEAAAVYRNDEHAQRTVWENYIKQAQRADRGVDDLTLMLTAVGRAGPPQGEDIRNARDQIYYRGNRSW